MKKKEIIKLITFPILLIGCVVSLDLFLFRQVSDDLTSYGAFYKEQEEALDVVLIGNSTLREGYIPTLMWNENGITSRGLSSSPTHPEVIKVAIDEVVRVQKPKAVFIDLNGLTFQRKEDAEFFIKQYHKALPKGKHKEDLEKVYSYLRDNDDEFELFNNHNNFRQQQYWESLVYPDQFKTKGYFPNNIIFKVSPMELDPTKKLPLTEDGEAYFNEIIAQCDKYKDDVQFIFGKMPRYNCTQGDLDSEYMFRTIESKLEGTGYLFADFARDAEKIGLDSQSDFKDLEHLNHLGSIKFTRYFAKYLKEVVNLDIKEKSQSVVDNFNEADNKTKDYLKGIEDNLNRWAGKS